MDINQEHIAAAVKKVLLDLVEEKAARDGSASGIFETIDEAVESAVAAQKRLLELTLVQRGEIIAAIRKTALEEKRKTFGPGGEGNGPRQIRGQTPGKRPVRDQDARHRRPRTARL